MDEMLPLALIDVLQYGFALLGIVVVVAISNPWLIIPTVIICLIFWYIRFIYLRTSRSVKRLEGVCMYFYLITYIYQIYLHFFSLTARSPVFSHLNASFQGLTTIRAFDADEILINEFDRHQDQHSSAWFIFLATSRAFGFYLDFLSVIYVAVVIGSFFFSLTEDEVDGKPDASTVGLAITQSIGLTSLFQWAMRQSTELENQMTSVERIVEYR